RDGGGCSHAEGEWYRAHDVRGSRKEAGLGGPAESARPLRRRSSRRIRKTGPHHQGIMRTQVGIVGAGPAGLLLSHLLHLENIESVVLEDRSRTHVENRLRAGVLEQGTVDILNSSGVGERLSMQGLVHHGLELSFQGRRHRIDLYELTNGRAITVYGQTEVVKDLIEARLQAGGQVLFEVEDVAVSQLTSEEPSIRFKHNSIDEQLECQFIAGCDGFHGVCRPSIPVDALRVYERSYPFGWLGILAQSTPP